MQKNIHEFQNFVKMQKLVDNKTQNTKAGRCLPVKKISECQTMEKRN